MRLRLSMGDQQRHKFFRRGNVLFLSAIMMIFMTICLAFAIDLGYMCVVRTEAQASADSAALAAGWEMVGEDRLRGDFYSTYLNTRTMAAQFASLNPVGVHNPDLQMNYENSDMDGDIVLGRLEDPTNKDEQLSVNDPTRYNAVVVRVRCTPERNQQSRFFFSRIMGRDEFGTVAEAMAIFEDDVVGFRVPANGPNSSLMPFTVNKDSWLSAVFGATGTDNWSFDSETGQIFEGSDGVPELAMYPIPVNGSTGDNTGAGNWGTVDFGASGNSSADLERQILHGLSADDLEYFGGRIELDPATGTLDLNGDTGISGGIKDALNAVRGRPRTIVLFDEVYGTGNTTNFRIVGFVGIRIVDLKLTGQNKYVVIQPAYVTDQTVITAPGQGKGYFVGKPVHLVR